MGLDIGVGVLATAVEDGDDEAVAGWEATFRLLNEVLQEAGLPAHEEPRSIPPEHRFEAQMWGYGGIHYLRRLAAHLAMQRRLPDPLGDGANPEDDPILDRLFQMHANGGPADGWGGIFKWFRAVPQRAPFEHLLVHSDCEGFYLPRTLPEVVFDYAEPQREGIGAMVGSSVSLLEECRTLADAIELPAGIDPEADELWEAADGPIQSGSLWQKYGVEAFTLARLMKACERSVETGAAIAFL